MQKQNKVTEREKNKFEPIFELIFSVISTLFYTNDESVNLVSINENNSKSSKCTGKYACPSLSSGCTMTKVVNVTLNAKNQTVCEDCRCVKCSQGLRPSSLPSKICVDIDECRNNWWGEVHHPCSHGCTNLDKTINPNDDSPGYYCHCPAGMVLGLDKHTCRVLSTEDFPIRFYVTQQEVVTKLTLQMNETDSKGRPNWAVVDEEYIFEKEGAIFTGIAVDDNGFSLSDDGSLSHKSSGKSANIYFGQYLGDRDAKTGQVVSGGKIYRYSEKTGNTELFYEFSSGRVEKMAFDHISGLLHVTISNYNHTAPCDETKTTKVGLHVIFPTYSKNKSKIPFFTHHVTLTKPRGIVTVPDLGAVYIVDWLGSKSKTTKSTIHKITFSNFAAGEFKVISKNITMTYPNNIIHDAFHKRLIIIDKMDMTKAAVNMVSCDYNLRYCKRFGYHSVSHPYGIDMLGKYMVAAEMKQPELSIMDIYNPADIKVIKRFGKQTYNVAIQNYNYQAKSGLTQNKEICKTNKMCDYMCITYDLESFAKITGQTYNATNAGVMGATCMCPDGSMNNTKGAVCEESGSDSYKLNPNYAKHFNGSRFRSGEFFNPIDRKLYKWDPTEGLLHILEFEILKCSESQTFNKIAESEILYQSKGTIRNNLTFSYSYDDNWIVGLPGNYKMNFRKPVVVPELNLVCGYTYVKSSNAMPTGHDYILYCFKLDDIAKTKKSAIGMLTANAPHRFHADQFSMVVLDHIEEKIDFYDWYNIHTGVTYHQANISDFEEIYGKFTNVYHVDGLNGEAFLTTSKYLLNYVVDDNNRSENGEINMVLNMTKLADANPSLTKYCNLTSANTYSWEFQNIEVMNKTDTARLYGAWKIDCEQIVDSGVTYQSYGYYYQGKTYVTVSKIILFSCKIDSRRKELDTNDCKVIDSAGKVDSLQEASDHIPHWSQFIDLQEGKIKPVDCDNEKNLKSKGIKCEYFCALEPYTGRAAHCVCPISMKWDEAKAKCVPKQDCIKSCKDKDGKDTCLTDELLCDGYDDCADGSDEKFEGCTIESCAADQFVCGGEQAFGGNATGVVKVCLPWHKRCNGEKDCTGTYAGWDEDDGCDVNFQHCNETGKFFCTNNTAASYSYGYDDSRSVTGSDVKGWCLDWFFVDDDINHCYGGKDEKYGASKAKCNRKQGKMCSYSYNNNPQCLTDQSSFCDGIEDCSMSASSYVIGTHFADKSEETTYFCKYQNVTCDLNTHFRCPTSRQCIDRKLLCDGYSNCNDGAEDESFELCKGKSAQKADAYRKQLNFFRHVTNNRTKAWDSADACNSNMYCIKAGIQICVESSMLCDGKKDCDDGIDEGGECGVCKKLSAIEKQVCGECKDTPQGPECSCDSEALKPEHTNYTFVNNLGKRVWKNEFKGYYLLERSKTQPKCRFRNFCNVIGTCDQKCIPLNRIDENTKGPYQCRCKADYRVAGPSMHHCKRMYAVPRIYLLDENDVIREYTLPRSSAIGSAMSNISVIGDSKQLNHQSTQRKLISQWRGEFNHVVKRFVVGPYDKSIYSVERGADGFDIIYIKPIAGKTNWDVMVNLPPVLIEDITLGMTKSTFNYMFISAQVKNKFGIYALTLSGNAALVASGVPKTRSVNMTDSESFSDFDEPPKNLLFNLLEESLYFSYKKTLYRYQMATRKIQIIKSFSGDITSMAQDIGWDKIVVVVNKQDIHFVSLIGDKSHQVHLHPKMPKISSIMIWEDQLIVADSVFYRN